MALWTRQLSRYCLLLNAYNTMKSSELRKQSIKTWRCFLEPPDLQQLCPNRYFCQMLLKNFRILHLDNHMLFCSSSSGTSQTSLSFTDKPKTEIVSSLDTDVLLQDLEDELPLSALEEISENEALQIKAAPPPPLESFSLRDYIDHSETLRKLVLLGVDLSRVEKRPNAGQLLVKLDFENDIKKILLFLKDIGLEDTQLGAFLTKNPYILNEEVEDLKTRVNYLISKKFTKEAITQMVFRAPYLLLFSVERLDNRLGYFQNELGLNPRKVYELELGFSKNEIRHIAHTVPKNLSTSKIKLTQMFDYLHNVMGIPHKLMVLFPQIFNAKLLRIKERHLFLKFLGRAQYDPGQPSYISLEKLVVLPDDVFCADVAKAEVKDFEKFLKTL
ncbi:transcription termination factor 3, mitochondrial isoform X2 [Python bivittatus]|uniref:Transcription termination factor 3, mitochondrial isoform X2 n=1 Tax=Python bivittatus TaxID=176946 RepID=A0A9F5IEU9_PYTBI|nr:transcription termination factor 3, mitochondrial isoform X2 [Python bivittatus]